MIRQILKISLYLVLVLIPVLAAGLLLLNSDWLKESVQEYVEQNTGHRLQIEGAIGPYFFPPALKLERVSLAQGDKPAWLEAEIVELRPDTLRLVVGDRSALKLSLERVNVLPFNRDSDPSAALQFQLPERTIMLELVDLAIRDRDGSAVVSDSGLAGWLDPAVGMSLAWQGRTRLLPFQANFRLTPVSPAGVSARAEATIDYAGLDVTLKGEISDYTRLAGLDIEISAGGALNGIELDDSLSRPFLQQNAIGRLFGAWPELRLDLKELSGFTEAGAIYLAANIRQQEAGISLQDGRVWLESRDIGEFLKEFGIDSKLSGQLNAEIQAKGESGVFELTGFNASLNRRALVFEGNGRLETGPNGLSLAADLIGRSQNLPEILQGLDRMDWLGGEGRLQGHLFYSDGRFSLSGLDASFDGDKGQFRATGSIEDLRTLQTDELNISFQQAKSGESPGTQRIEVEVNADEGITGAADLTGGVNTHSGKLEFSARVANPRKLTGIEGQFRYLPEWSAALAPGQSGQGFTGVFTFTDVSKGEFTAQGSMLGSEGAFEYRGAVSEGEGRGRLIVTGMNPNSFAALAGLETDLPDSIQLEAEVIHDAAGVGLENLSLAIGNSDLRGQWSIQYANGKAPPRISTRLQSRHLELTDLGVDETPGEGFFSGDSLNLDSLKEFDLDFELAAESLITRALEYRQVQASGRSRGGQLKLKADQNLLGGGNAVTSISVDASVEPPWVQFKSNINRIDPGELRAIKDNDEGYSGNVDVEVDIHGRGHSVREIAGNANGVFVLRANSAVIPNRKLQLLSADFLLETFRFINPFIKTSDSVELECGLAAFRIVDGVAQSDKFIILKARKMLVVGTGEVDLESEELKLSLYPKAQEGIGLNTSSLVKSIGIGGTLSEPKTRTDAKGLIMSGASIGAAVATGGVSLFLQNIFDRVTTNKKQCAHVEEKFRESLLKPPKSKRQAPAQRGFESGLD